MVFACLKVLQGNSINLFMELTHTHRPICIRIGKMGGCQGSNGKIIWHSRDNAPGEEEQSIPVFLIWEVPSTQQALKKIFVG